MQRDGMPAICLTQPDFDRLGRLLATYAQTRPSRAADILKGELARAKVVGAADIPSAVVTMHSRVRIRDEHRNQERVVTLVYPLERGSASDALSVLTSLGAALIGLSEGQSITFTGPDGRQRRVTVEKCLGKGLIGPSQSGREDLRIPIHRAHSNAASRGTEVSMSKVSKQEQAKRKLDLELDRQLEDTFPASDALKITRRRPDTPATPRQTTDDQACLGIGPPAILP